MLKKPANGVLASLPGTVNRETRVSSEEVDLPADKVRPWAKKLFGQTQDWRVKYRQG
jgi:hypothetical protein